MRYVDLVCERCGSPFRVSTRHNSPPRRYCSRPCASRGKSNPELRQQVQSLRNDGLKQTDIAARLGISQSLVSRYVLGKTTPGMAIRLVFDRQTGALVSSRGIDPALFTEAAAPR